LNFASDSKAGNLGASKILIGRFTYGYENISVHQWGEGANLTIGSFCSLAKNITVMLGGNHRLDWATTFPFGHIFTKDLGGTEIVGHPATKGNIVIGNDVWIGSNVTLMSGVTIGDGAAIAAKSTVRKNIADYEVWGGNPAVKIKDRFPKSITQKLAKLQWWKMETETIRKIAPVLSQAPTDELLDAILAANYPHMCNEADPVRLPVTRSGSLKKL